MGLRVNTDAASINAQRHLTNTAQRPGGKLERLTSGLRINPASDDAADLAISRRLESDVRELSRARRNASDGIALLQTADGALDEITSILVRMRELAQQAAAGALDSGERSSLDQEFQSLTAEISRIADTAGFGPALNRIETAIRNSANVEENLSAANSRIRDLDIATKSANTTAKQIMQQAGVSILSQANMTAQIALTLLQGTE